ncbi:MAG: efflux RND transporter permease subunit [Firmicutes bacterium]|nr:efflux RND transporter permease subunit [Bacillota bacterium]
MNLSEMSIARPVTTVMITLIVVILGVVSLLNLQQELMPEMDLGIAVVIATYEGAGPEEIENLVTSPLENALSIVSNLQNITTTSSAGSSMIVLEFEDGTDMDNASLNMRENIDMFRPLLPDGVEPRVLQIDPNMMQSFVVGITGDYDMVRLRTVVDDQIIRRIERLDGVGSVTLGGGMEREIGIELYPARLAGYGVSAAQVAGILAQENVNRPGGALVQGDVNLNVRTVNEFQSVQDIENLPLITPMGAIIRLSNVANVVDGFAEITTRSIINGQPGVTLSITQQSTANTVEVGDRVKAELEILQREFPQLNFVIISDTSHFIVTALANVWTTVFQATALAMIVLLVFLGNFRSPLIIGVSIPVSLVASLALMYFTDMTLNMVSLNALVISVGLLVDNAIVVLESIARYIDMGMDPKEASKRGAGEVRMAVTASTLTTLAVFLPVIFVTGIAGEMFGQLAIVLSFALICSLAVSMTFIPMACSKFLRPNNAAKFTNLTKSGEKGEKDEEDFGGLKPVLGIVPPVPSKNPIKRFFAMWAYGFKKLEDGYVRVLNWGIHHKAAVIGMFLVFLVASGIIIPGMGMEFMAPMDQGQINISVTAPDGALLDETTQLTNIILERIDGMAEIEDISATIGGGGGLMNMFGGGGGASGGNTASIFIQLVARDERGTIDDIMEEMRYRIEPLPGAEFTVSAENGGMGMGGGNSVSFSIFGDDMESLSIAGAQAVDLISTLPNIRNAASSLQDGYPQAQVVVDRQRASHHGLQASAVANTVQMAIAGTTITQYRVGGTEIDVVMRYQPDRLVHVVDLQNLMITTQLGTSIPLSEVATISIEQGPTAITKQNQRQFITISADFVDTDLNTITQEITALLDNHVFFTGITYEFGGAFEMMMDSFEQLILALILGFVLLYMVIASQFESLAYPSTILFSIPIAWTAGLFGIWVFGGNISVVSFIGLIMLMGIVINNGIILVDFINTKRSEGMVTVDAILYAGRARLRPILMTTVTTVLGLLPMLFAAGEGAEMLQPMGATIVFGLSFSTMITLILIPTLYLILHNLRKKIYKDKKERGYA